MTSLDQARQTVDAYASAQAKLTASLIRVLGLLWGGFQYWDNHDMVRAYAARSAVDVDIALAEMRKLSRTYMLTRLTQLGAPAVDLPVTYDSYERGGAAIVEVYQRPARERNFVHRSELSDGTPAAQAAEIAQSSFIGRLQHIVESDVAVTARDETSKVMAASPKAIGYRRIIHPERSKTGVCGLCIAASTRLYTISELMPLHGDCKCTVDAVTADADPGMDLNTEDLNAMLAQLYGAAGSTYAEDLKKVRTSTVEHGELGPLLIKKGSNFRTVADVNRDTKYAPKATPFQRQTRADDQTNWAAMKATSERSVRYLLNAKSRGTNLVDMTGRGRPVAVKDLDKAIQYHRDLIARAMRHAA